MCYAPSEHTEKSGIQGHPQVQLTLSYLGAAYLLWLSRNIATAAAPEVGAAAGRPIGFLQAAGFQWVNPKAWMIALGAVATFTSADGNFAIEVAIIVIAFAAVVYPCVSVWALFGGATGRLLHRLRLGTGFNVTIELLLVESLAWPLVTTIP